MPNPYFKAETLDDLMHDVIDEILSTGKRIEATKGWNTELSGVLLELTNPRARLSRTETRANRSACLGELCWYLARTNDLAFIEYYLPEYKKYADGDVIFGGYGPRLFDWRGLNQMDNVVALLKRKPHTRQAVIQLFDAFDIMEARKDIPCTCTLQFMIRSKRLNMFTTMRSNDAYWGLPHDVFALPCFRRYGEDLGRRDW